MPTKQGRKLKDQRRIVAPVRTVAAWLCAVAVGDTADARTARPSLLRYAGTGIAARSPLSVHGANVGL
jgi:hypothetical protein